MTDASSSVPPLVVQTVLDAENVRDLAEFYRQMFGLEYRRGDEPAAGNKDWLVLHSSNGPTLAFQQVDQLPRATWPEGPHPQQLHLDTKVTTAADLTAQRQRALDLGATELYDRFDDPDEPLYVFADPAGHPFCIFVAP